MRISKSPVSEISVSLSTFKQAVNELEEDFDMQDAKDHAEIIKHRGQWTDAYMQEQRDVAKQKNLDRLRPRYQQAQKKVSDDCAFQLSIIKRRFDKYFLTGCRPEYVSKLEAYKTMGVVPSKREIQLLCDEAYSYSEKQILKAYLLDLGKPRIEVRKDDKGKDIEQIFPPLVDMTDYERYGLDAVDFDDAYNKLDEFRDAVEDFIKYYCNGNADIYSLTGNDSIKNIGNGKTVASDSFIFQGSNANRYFEGQKEQMLKDEIDRLNGITERKTELTDAEKNLLHSLFAPLLRSELPTAVKGVWESDARLASLIEMHPEYQKYINE